jgi:hypothetical protein
MYPNESRKSRSKIEDKQVVYGIAFFFGLALCMVMLILGGLIS